jgi:hypothetical protein
MDFLRSSRGFLAVGFGGIILQATILSYLSDSSGYLSRPEIRTALSLGLQGLAALVFVVLASRAINNTREDTIVLRLVGLITFLEVNAADWQLPRRRREINQRLEAVATLLEKLPFEFGVSNSEISIGLLRSGHLKGQGVRALQVWVCQPSALTYTDLVARLSDCLAKFCRGRWYDLPDGPPRLTGISKKKRVFWALLASVALVIFVGVQIYGAKAGQLGSVASSLLSFVAIASLGQLGITPGTIGAYLDTSKKTTLDDHK